MSHPGQQAVIDEWKAAVAASGIRSRIEWKGKTGDSVPPDAVKLRIFDLWGGRCYLTGVRLRPGHWDLEHVIPLHAGGSNSEGNLRPAAKEPHKAKTKKERKTKAKVDAMAKKHIGMSKPKTPMPVRETEPAAPQKKASGEIVKKEPKARPDPFEHLSRPSMFRKMTPDEISAQKD
tara:strand:+ start:1001 stop:1528 length:528 start_codon:yes stop_codon:yes gene_type:complete